MKIKQCFFVEIIFFYLDVFFIAEGPWKFYMYKLFRLRLVFKFSKDSLNIKTREISHLVTARDVLPRSLFPSTFSLHNQPVEDVGLPASSIKYPLETVL